MSIFSRHSKSETLELELRATRELLREKQNELHTATFDLAEAKNLNKHLKEQLSMANTNPANPTNSIAPKNGNRLSIPIDLGQDIVVYLEGMPGRPTRAACERICKIIMSYAVDPVSITVVNNSQEVTLPINSDLLAEDLKISEQERAALKLKQKHSPEIIPAPLGAKATMMKPVSPNPDV